MKRKKKMKELIEIGNVLASALKKLRGVLVLTPKDVQIAEELARRWDAKVKEE